MHSSALTLAPAIRWRIWLASLLLGLCAWLPSAWAQQLVPVPALTARVMDQTGTLSPTDKAALEAKLAAYEQARGSQLVVLMVATTQPEDIASFGYRVASTWKIGRRDVGDGILIIVAKDDRRMRIEVAKALEGAVPDIAAGRIIDDAMKPRFRVNDFAGGISAAVDQITARLDGEALPLPGSTPAPSPVDEGMDWMSAIVIVAMISLIGGGILKSLMGRPLGSMATGALAGGTMFLLSGVLLAAGLAGLAGLFIALVTGMGGGGGMLPPGGGGRGRGGPIILPGPPTDWGRGGSWGGGGGFGGGFGSGGGGDFGGGGASGDW